MKLLVKNYYIMRIRKIALITFLIYFFLLARAYVLFFPYTPHFKSLAPVYIVITRDIVALLFIFFTLVLILLDYMKMSKEYFYKILFFLIFYLLFLLISLLHIINIPLNEVIQHNFRNFSFYSMIGLVIVPLYITRLRYYESIFNKLIIFSLFLFVAGVLLQYNFSPTLFAGRLLASLENPNTYGNFIVFILLLTTHKIIFSSNKKIITYIIIGVVNLVALLLTGSFQNIFGLFIGISILFLMYNKAGIIKFKKLIFIVFLMGVPVIMLVYILYNFDEIRDVLNITLIDRFNAIFLQRNSASTSVSGRISQFHYILLYIRSSNFVDLFFGNFHVMRYLKFDSQYYQIIVNNGLPLFIGFIFLFLNFFYKIQQFLKKVILSSNKKFLIKTNFIPIVTYIFWVIFYSNFFTAMLNRFPINFLFGFCIGYVVFSIISFYDFIKKNHDYIVG